MFPKTCDSQWKYYSISHGRTSGRYGQPGPSHYQQRPIDRQNFMKYDQYNQQPFHPCNPYINRNQNYKTSVMIHNKLVHPKCVLDKVINVFNMKITTTNNSIMDFKEMN